MTTEIERDENATLISADKVKGTTVYDSSDEKIGDIDEIVINKRSGHVSYAVLSFGGFLGIGEKYHPLPWNALTYDTSIGGYRVQAVGSKFHEAPSFTRDEVQRGGWSEATDKYYNDPKLASWLGRSPV